MNISNLIEKGGPMMWPLLAASVLGMTVVLERLFFLWQQRRNTAIELRQKILTKVELGDTDEAFMLGRGAKDSIVVMLMAGLRHRESVQTALMAAAAGELKKYTRGLTILDTIITLAPLLGLLGTVTGMIHAFGMLGGGELEAPAAITGGIAEALIATAFGLTIAIICLIPFNGLNACAENIKHEMEQDGSFLESLLAKKNVREAPYETAIPFR